MKLYLAGPMRGIPDHNYPAFIAAASQLRAEGHTVFSPVDWDKEKHGPDGCKAETFDLREALAADLEFICRHAEAVAVLPGWENSKGAQSEVATARALGLPVMPVGSTNDGVIRLPFPVSVNAMFADGKTRRHKSQKYCDWLLEAGYQLNRQNPQPIKGQVILSYVLGEIFDGRKRDVGNYEKGVTDLLVKHGVIEADDHRIVREIKLRWSREVTGAEITIQPITTEQRSVA